MSDSNRRKAGDDWPHGERRRTADRRVKTDRRVERELRGRVKRKPARDRRKKERRAGSDRRDEEAWQQLPIDEALSTSGPGEQELHVAAVDAREHAQAAYSHFKVGAALQTIDGRIITGCNIENATYGLTLCAERVALVKALSEGHTAFTRILIAADTDAPTPPCGACRQLLWEYCGDIDVVLASLQGPSSQLRLADLLPMPFDRRLLE